MPSKNSSLLILAVILGLPRACTIPSADETVEQSGINLERETEVRIETLSHDLQMAVLRFGCYPQDLLGTEDLLHADPHPVDSWGNPILLAHDLDGVYILSMGADGTQGTADDLSGARLVADQCAITH